MPRARIGRTDVVIVLALCALGWGVLAYGRSPAIESERAHDAAVARWGEREPAAYVFEWVGRGGTGLGCRMRVTVRDGEPVEAEEVAMPEAVQYGCSDTDLSQAPTVDDLFASEVSARDEDHYEISYDPELGFPTELRSWCDDGADCASGWSVTDFEVTDFEVMD